MRGERLATAARAAGPHQGYPGHRRAAHHLWQPVVRRPRAHGRPGSVARLRAAGAIILGKTNTPEWAAGGNTRNPVHGATGNPFDPSRSAAGSSGGSAVALACGMAPLASGSDTGGSLRNPAAYARHRRHASVLRARRQRAAPVRLVQSLDRRPDGAQCRRRRADAVGDGERRCARSPGLYAAGRDRSAAAAERWTPPQPADSEQVCASPSPRISASRRPSTRSGACFATASHGSRRWFAECREASPDCAGADDAFAVLRAALFLATHGKTYQERPDMLGPNVRANVEEGLALQPQRLRARRRRRRPASIARSRSSSPGTTC